MKRKLTFVLLIFCALTAAAQDNASKGLFVGGPGPAGGVVFAISGNKAWEMSEPLGKMSWDKAFKSCPHYRGGGHDDWYLPTKEELESIYYNLVKKGILQDTETYWSSNQEESMALWGYNFNKGRPGLYGAARKLAVRAVRHFKLD